MVNRSHWFVFSLFCALALSGCGGGKSTVSVPPLTADFTTEVSWYPAARSIRTDAASIKVIIEDANHAVLFERILNRPLNVDVVDKQTFQGVVPRGTMMVTYIAFDNVGGQGNELARGSTMHEFVPGSANPVPVVLGDTVSKITLLDLPPRFVLQGAPEVRARYEILNPENTLVLSDLTKLVYNPENAVVSGLYSAPGWHRASIVSGSKIVNSATWVEPPTYLPSGLHPDSPWPSMGGDDELSQMGKGPSIQSPMLSAVALGSTLRSPDSFRNYLLVMPDQDVMVIAETSDGRQLVARYGPKGLGKRYSDSHLVRYVLPLLHRNGKVYTLQESRTRVRVLDPVNGALIATSQEFNYGNNLTAVGDWLVAGSDTLRVADFSAIPGPSYASSLGYFKGRVWSGRGLSFWPGSQVRVDVRDFSGGVLGYGRTGPIYFDNGFAKELEPQSGSIVSQFNIGYSYFHATYLHEILVNSDYNETTAYEISSGRVLWQRPRARSFVTSADGTAYLLTNQNDTVPAQLTAVNVRTGQQLWSIALGRYAASDLAMAADGTLYCLSNDGYLMVISE